MAIVWGTAWSDAWPAYRATPGAVVGAPHAGGRLVKTGDSVILVREVELEGTPPGPPAWPVGTRLGTALTVGAGLVAARGLTRLVRS